MPTRFIEQEIAMHPLHHYSLQSLGNGRTTRSVLVSIFLCLVTAGDGSPSGEATGAGRAPPPARNCSDEQAIASRTSINLLGKGDGKPRPQPAVPCLPCTAALTVGGSLKPPVLRPKPQPT